MNKKFEYGNLRHVEEEGWVFIKSNNDVKKLGKEGIIETFNALGMEGWELIELEEQVGYIFKKEVKL